MNIAKESLLITSILSSLYEFASIIKSIPIIINKVETIVNE